MAALITRLPNELLCEVFLCLRDSIHWEAVDLGKRERWPHRWIHLCHVCRRWRDVAIQCPQLWRHIIFTRNSERVSTFLQRSGDVLLTFRQGGLTHAGNVGYVETVYQYLHRVVEVDNLIISEAQVDGLSQFQTTSHATELPLESLCFKVTADSLPTLSTTSLPRLRILAVNFASYHALQPFLRPTLTHLTLSEIWPLYSVFHFLSLLRDLPCLEALHLHATLSSRDVPTDIPPSSRQTQLPRLRELSIGCSREERAGVLLARNIEAPITVLVLIGQFSSNYVSDIRALSRTVIRNMVAIEERYYRNGSVITFVDRDPSIFFKIETFHYDPFWVKFFTGSTLPEVHRLDWSFFNCSVDTLKAMDRSAPRVSYLGIHGDDSVENLVGLMEQELDEEGWDDGQMLFANLTTLVVYLTYWNDEYLGHTTPWKAPLFERLEAVLRRRRERGIILSSLRLVDAVHVGVVPPGALFTDVVTDFQLSETTCHDRKCSCHADLVQKEG